MELNLELNYGIENALESTRESIELGRGQFGSGSKTMELNHFGYDFKFGLDPTHAHPI